jgi:hypothetical protein
MRDIFEVLSDDVVTFTAETDHARDWMVREYHESTRRYAIRQPTERAEAERFKKAAGAEGLEVYGLLSN